MLKSEWLHELIELIKELWVDFYNAVPYNHWQIYSDIAWLRFFEYLS